MHYLPLAPLVRAPIELAPFAVALYLVYTWDASGLMWFAAGLTMMQVQCTSAV